MDLNYFQTFCEVAYYQSFTKAAEKLGYAQSSVTTQIQKLEQFYGVKLFERFGRGLRLTSAGEELLKTAHTMLQLFQQSQESLSAQGGGSLTIGAIDSIASYYLPPMIQKLRGLYPDLNIRLQTGREMSIMERVKEGEYDFGLLLESAPSDPDLQWIKIREEPLLLVTRRAPSDLNTKSIQLADLHDKEWLLTEHTCNYRIMAEQVLRAHQVPYRVGLELGNPEAIKRCLKVGTGLSLLPKMVVQEELDRGELTVLPFEHPDIRLDLYLVIHPKKWISQSLQSFIEMLKQGEKGE